MYKPINDYGLIGNLGSCALVGLDGSIDWACLPHLDSPALFSALLDSKKGGRFQIVPEGKYSSSQAYMEDTNILETTFTTPTGVVTITDFMPFFGEEEDRERPVIYRVVKGASGLVKLDITFEPRLDYARAETKLAGDDTKVVAKGGGQSITLTSARPIAIKGDEAGGSIEINRGEEVVFALGYGLSLDNAPEAAGALTATARKWTAWAHRCEESMCVFGGPWHAQVVRSAFTLKMLTHSHTGAVAAAATTSLPEEIGGERNWDYRFAWLRDASFTVQALHNLGHREEAEAFLAWFQQAISPHASPSEIQIMYSLHGETTLKEEELKHLEGYRGSRPVRIGNKASEQRQLDIYGEVIDAAYQLTRYGSTLEAEHWPFICSLADYVSGAWKEKDAGIWEVRGGVAHFVYSKVMCWVALDRAVKLSKVLGHAGDVERWSAGAAAIRKAVLTEGYNDRVGAFVQSFGSDVLDASNLLIPLVGFLPFDDERVKSTIDATKRELSDGAFVHRYRADDGLKGNEGAFLLCSFWLIDCLTLSGRVDEAIEAFEKISSHANHLGLFAEEIDPATGAFLGNFPQAFTHIGFINSALYLGRALGKEQMGPNPMGSTGG
ncbi:MAG: glycoside hydrolase family 15 protein [Thermodesulfobacteriota bacterium]